MVRPARPRGRVRRRAALQDVDGERLDGIPTSPRPSRRAARVTDVIVDGYVTAEVTHDGTGTFAGQRRHSSSATRIVSTVIPGHPPPQRRQAPRTRAGRPDAACVTTRSRWSSWICSGWTGCRCWTSRCWSVGDCSNRSSPRRTSCGAGSSSGRRSTPGWGPGAPWGSPGSRSRPPTAVTRPGATAQDWVSIAMPRR